jgi:hypothetical protein
VKIGDKEDTIGRTPLVRSYPPAGKANAFSIFSAASSLADPTTAA